jgi:hypothetical protein
VSRVAEILLQQGRIAGEAARARREIWGGAIQNIAQLPLQIGHQRQQQAMLDLQRQREQRLTQAAQAEAETRMLALDEHRKQAIAGSAAKLLAMNPNPSDEDAQRWYQGVRQTFRPDEQGMLDQLLKQPGGGKQVLTYIAPMAKPSEGFTLGEGQVRYGPAGRELARGPAKAVRPVAPTEASLAQAAASGDETAAKALQLLQTQNREKSPTNVDLAIRAVNGDPKAAAALSLLKPAREVTPTAALEGTLKLRDRFVRETSAAQIVNTQLQLMKSSLTAAEQGNMAAGSQGVLVTFQKILDPTSVVRESEYARSASGQALLSRIEGAYDRLSKGGAGVPVSELKQFVTLAEQFARNQAESAKATKQQIDAIATEYGLKPENITRDFGPAPIGGAPPPTRATPKLGEVVTVKGQRVRVIGINPDGTLRVTPVR